MNIYLAGRYSTFPDMQKRRAQLHALGHKVTSRWIEGNHDERAHQIGIKDEHEKHVYFAQEDWDDLWDAHLSIHFTEDPNETVPGRARGGRHVEFGIALTLGFLTGPKHRIMIVGHRENVFHYLPFPPGIRFFETWEECLEFIRSDQPLYIVFEPKEQEGE